MADYSTTAMNGEFLEEVNITGDEISDYDRKIAELSDEITVLEKEKQQVVHENNNMKELIEKTKESMKKLSSENEDLKGEIERLGLENKTLQSVAARAAELEGEVSRLQHDLISATSDLEEANGEIVRLKSKVESLENGEKGKKIKMDAVVSERNLLVVKVEGLVAKAVEKEKEIRGLESRIKELKLVAREKEELERKVKEMEGKLEEKERVINGLEVKQRQVDGLVNGKVDVALEDMDVGSVVDGVSEKNHSARLKEEWAVVAVSAVGAVAVMGVTCYLHYKKR